MSSVNGRAVLIALVATGVIVAILFGTSAWAQATWYADCPDAYTDYSTEGQSGSGMMGYGGYGMMRGRGVTGYMDHMFLSGVRYMMGGWDACGRYRDSSDVPGATNRMRR